MNAIFKQGGDGVCIARNRSVLPGEYAVKTKLKDWSKGKKPAYYMDVDNTLTPRDDDTIMEIKKNVALNAMLEKIDLYRSGLEEQTFSCDGHNYYPDDKRINGIITALPLLPESYVEVWKTADTTDGVNNVYVTLDKAGLEGLGVAYLTHQKTAYAVADAHKKAVKAIYEDETKTDEDIKKYPIED